MSLEHDAVVEGRGPSTTLRRAARGLVGSFVGAVMVPALLFALLAAPLSTVPAHTVAGWVARRLDWIEGTPHEVRPRGGRLLGLLAIEALLGLVSGCVLALIGMGLLVAITMVIGAATGGGVAVFDAEPGAVTWMTVLAYTIPGAALLFFAVSGLAGTGWLGRRAWAGLARPGAGELAEEVTRLHSTLDDVVAAVDAERRRIERDIHDGVQQQVVALSILLARAERVDSPEERAGLHHRAAAQTQQILDDLRGVAWRT